MFQTTPASAGLGKMGLEPSAGSQDRTQGSDSSFSQEFDKQVKNLDAKSEGESGTGTDSPPGKSGQQATAAKDGQSGDNGERSEIGGQGSDATQVDAQTGNILPQPLAALPPLELLSDEPTGTESGIAISASRQELTLLPGEDEKAVAASEEISPIQPLAFAPVAVAASDVPVASDAESVEVEDELAPLRLRDMVTAQRLVAQGSERGAESVVVKEAKFDLQSLLPGQLVQGRSPSGNENVVLTSTTSAVVPSVAQGSVSTLPAAMTLAAPLQQKGWDQAMSERVVWMARSNIQEAQIQLNPRELGPIEIKLQVKQDQAHVQFVAHHATTREALEAAMPRLREMLNESGLNLAQSDVSQHSFRDSDRNSPGNSSVHTASADTGLGSDGAEELGRQGHVSYIGPRGIDYFA